MEWGSSLEALLQFKEQSGVTPKALQNRPYLREDCQKYKDAYIYCSRGRQAHQAGMQSIPLTEIESYLNIRYIYALTEREAVMRLVQAQDDVFQKHIAKKIEQQTQSKAT